MIARLEPVTLADVDSLNAMFEAQRGKKKRAKDRSSDPFAVRPEQWFTGIKCRCGSVDCHKRHDYSIPTAVH